MNADERSLNGFYFDLGFTSFFEWLRISDAVWSISFESVSLGGSYVDQRTSRDLMATTKTVPLARPNVECVAGFSSLFTVSVINAGEDCVWSLLSTFAGSLGGAVTGFAAG